MDTAPLQLHSLFVFRDVAVNKLHCNAICIIHGLFAFTRYCSITLQRRAARPAPVARRPPRSASLAQTITADLLSDVFHNHCRLYVERVYSCQRHL